jgi:hypothetical protein
MPNHPARRFQLAHLLIVDLPNGQDTNILKAAIARGDQFTFLSSHLAGYTLQAAVGELLGFARELIDISQLSYSQLEKIILGLNKSQKIDAILQSLEARVEDFATLAKKLHLTIFNTTSKALEQNSLLTESLIHLKAFDKNHLPFTALDDFFTAQAVTTHRHLSCTVFAAENHHQFIGFIEHCCEPNSSIARGGRFIPNAGQMPNLTLFIIDFLHQHNIQQGLLQINLALSPTGIDFIGIDTGIAENDDSDLLMTALGRNIYSDLIDLSQGKFPLYKLDLKYQAYSVMRWIYAEADGFLDFVDYPTPKNKGVTSVKIFKKYGESIQRPTSTTDRLGYIMSRATTEAEAIEAAEEFIKQVRVIPLEL